MLVVSSVIGSGIFLTPGRVADLLPHPGAILAAWLAGGLLSAAGALANAELGAMYPHAGGDYVYLREAYHPAAGFMVGWLTFFVIYAGSIATLAAGFAEGLVHFVRLGATGKMLAAVAVTAVMSAVNYIGVRAGVRLNNVTAYCKMAALCAFVIAGPALGRGRIENLRPLLAGGSALHPAAFGLALSPVLFTYLGWNAPVYVASEIRCPSRTVPRSLFFGLGVCTLVYGLVNAVYVYAMPVATLRGTVNVGEAAAGALFGPVAGSVVATFVLVSILGTLDAMILVGPRIAYAMALDGLFFRKVSTLHPRTHAPVFSLAVQCVWATLLTLSGSYSDLLDYVIFAVLLFYILTIAGIFRLRRTRPDAERPYRALGYPVLPAAYMAAAGLIEILLLLYKPSYTWPGLIIVLLGVPVYFVWRKKEVRA